MSQDQWVIVELSHRGEKKDPDELKQLLRQELPDDVRIFIPSVTYEKGDHSVTIWLLEGYIFIEAGLRMARYFALEGTAYVSQVLTIDQKGQRHVRFIDEKQVQKIQDELREEASRDIEEGDLVTVREGVYSELTGEVVDFESGEKEATVKIKGMRTKEPEVTLPIVFLERE